MPYTACIHTLETHLKITVSGTMDSYEEQADFSLLLARLGNEYEQQRLLLDERLLRKHLDALDAYRLAESPTSAEAAVRGVRTACVPNPEDFAFAKILETSLSNRSISYRIFSTEAEAEAWLLR